MTTTQVITMEPGINIPLISHNSVVACGDFYISHNDHDISIYGCETTALVVGQMQAFYILNGDHREAYKALIPYGFDVCLEYFEVNIEHANKHSDRIFT